MCTELFNQLEDRIRNEAKWDILKSIELQILNVQNFEFYKAKKTKILHTKIADSCRADNYSTIRKCSSEIDLLESIKITDNVLVVPGEKEFLVLYKIGGQDYEFHTTALSKEKAISNLYKNFQNSEDEIWDVVAY